MSFLTELHTIRQKLIDALKDNKGAINFDIFKDFYPDKAHFLVELLQNAEDRQAQHCTFRLFPDKCEFTHDGTEQFTEANVDAITGLYNSTSRDDPDKIGTFGSGFKAVFAYTDTPHVWSQDFCFRITDYVLPWEIEYDPTIGSRTRFVFPFNSQDKLPAVAYAEIEEGFRRLPARTLLYLNHIKTVKWVIDNGARGELRRRDDTTQCVCVIRSVEGEKPSRSYYLRFTEPVEGLAKRHIAIAFDLELLKGKSGKRKLAFADRFKIVPANQGSVAVFFPAEKETSGLRFHLHAPFVTELSRASVKETPANTPLFEQLAEFAARVLPLIRDKGLLDREFLGVLPNLHDPIPERYRDIGKAIITAMNEQALTPTHSGKHAPAESLYQSSAFLKSLLSPEDVALLGSETRRNVDWAVSATQKNSDVDRFLSALSIKHWSEEEFVKSLIRLRSSDNTSGLWEIKSEEWLGRKPASWHQRLYAWLHEKWHVICHLHDHVRASELVRLSTGEYRRGDECYFPTRDVEHDSTFPRVAVDVYGEGEHKDHARAFLESVGVREVDEAVEVEAILKGRYTRDTHPSDDMHFDDLERFIGLVEEERTRAELFHEYCVFQGSDGLWHTPREVYLDRPYRDTGLAAYYDAIGPGADRVGLHDRYRCSGLDEDRFTAFCREVRVQTTLSIVREKVESSVYTWRLRCGFSRARTRSSGTDEDWTIPYLEKILHEPSVPLARLIWKTMCQATKDVLEARYSPNKKYTPKVGPSTLVQVLAKYAWVPQGDGKFVRPALADRSRLPDGFPFDSGQPWIDAIGFGKEVAERQEEYRRKRAVATELGFDSNEALEDAKWFASLPLDERQRYKREHERWSSPELPDSEPADPERRAQRVGEQAADAPDRQKEKRQRSFAKEYEAVKQVARQYLRPQYTNPDRKTICQVCQAPLPFKLADGQYYFEAVEFLPELKTKKHHYQNHLALCPNHAAMFVHANDSKDTLMSSFLEMEGQELPVVLAGEKTSIYFTKTHIIDLKAVIEIDQAPTEEA